MLNSNFGCIMDVRLERFLGMEPIKLLPDRSSSWRKESCDSCQGILPWSMFDRNMSTLSKGLLNPIHEGIVSESLFSPRSRISSLLHRLRKFGNPPLRPLFARCTDSSDKLKFFDIWTFPEKALLDKSMNSRSCMFHKQRGVCHITCCLIGPRFEDTTVDKAL